MNNNHLNFSGADVDPDFVDQASYRNPYSNTGDIFANGRPMQGDTTGRSYTGTNQPMEAADSYGNLGLSNEQNVGEPMGGAFGTTRSGHPTSGIDSDYYKSDNQAQAATSNRRQSLTDKIKEGYQRLTGQTTGSDPSAPYDDRLV